MLLPLAILLGALGLPRETTHAPASEPRIERALDIEQLEGEIAAWRRSFLDNHGVGQARSLVAELDKNYRENPASRNRVLASLLDLSGAALERRHERDPIGAFDTAERELLRATGRSIRPKLRDKGPRRYASHEVLLVASRNPVGRRAAACRAFGENRDEGVLLALLGSVDSEESLIARTTLDTLVGWDHESVHREMAKRLKGFSEHGAPIAQRHFQSCKLEKDSRSTFLLIEQVKRGLAARNWREASLAATVSNALPPRLAAPLLITGLSVWIRRGNETGGTVRIQHEIADRLKEISGRNLGLRPDRWRIWWKAVQSGDTQLAEAGAELEQAQFTSAGFFGLDPKSDRVTFVLDRSGSMDTVLANASRKSRSRAPTRFEAAVEQLMGFIETLGEQGRFSVVLFSNNASVWRTKLQPATKGNIRSVKKWISTRGPDGGTMLRRGIFEALQVDKRGSVDLESLEADTIVVLCDGATTEGRGWVTPFLDRNNRQARLRFHCVQIGSGGDGTLEALAEETGGDFRRVAP